MTDEQNERAACVAEEAYSAGNLVTCDGYYEFDLEAATAVIAREFEALEAENARLREALKQAEAVFTHYGELHAAKPDPVKARRNFDLADAMRAALKDTRHDAGGIT